jgi:hypothetical protein
VRKRKKYPIDGDRVIIKKGAKGFGGKEWAPRFTPGCITFKEVGLPHRKHLVQMLMVKYGVDDCIDFSKNPVEIPTWDKHQLDKASEAHVLKLAGNVEVKAQVPIVFYISLIISLITLGLLFVSGRIHF